MQLMKFLNYSSKFLLALLLLTAQPVLAVEKLAVVDLVRVYQEYSLVKEANKTINESEASLKRLIATAESEVKDLEAKTGAEAQKKREEIQANVDSKVIQVHEMKNEYNVKINRNLENAISTVATKNQYIAVIDKAYSVYNAKDVTDQVLATLEKIK